MPLASTSTSSIPTTSTCSYTSHQAQRAPTQRLRSITHHLRTSVASVDVPTSAHTMPSVQDRMTAHAADDDDDPPRADSPSAPPSSRPTAKSSASTRDGRRSPTLRRAFQLVPGVQSYEWGLKGRQRTDCLVANFAEATDELRFVREPDRPYAELWMGTHPSLPSRIVPTTRPSDPRPPSELPTLSAHLNRNPALLGEGVVARFGTGVSPPRAAAGPVAPVQAAEPSAAKDTGALPFLFKILSIGKALSIQAHPDKALARRLHKERPNSYKDDNHKPEMAIALTPFRGFCGFRPLGEIARFATSVPELAAVLQLPSQLALALADAATGPATARRPVEETKALIRAVFERLMRADADVVAVQLRRLCARYEAGVALAAEEVDVAPVVLRLSREYPDDVGVLCSFLLNVLCLAKGEAMFLRANEPHAYLEGNIVECMAASDNVVRAGLTPKERDVGTLVEMLTYRSGPSADMVMRPRVWMPHAQSASRAAYVGLREAQEVSLGDEGVARAASLVYDPPIEEFSVLWTRLGEGNVGYDEETQRALAGPSVLIVTEGEGELEVLEEEDHDDNEGGETPSAEAEAELPPPPSSASAAAAAAAATRINGTSPPPRGTLRVRESLRLARAGQVFFVGAHTPVTLRATAPRTATTVGGGAGGGTTTHLVVFRAFVEP